VQAVQATAWQVPPAGSHPSPGCATATGSSPQGRPCTAVCTSFWVVVCTAASVRSCACMRWPLQQWWACAATADDECQQQQLRMGVNRWRPWLLCASCSAASIFVNIVNDILLHGPAGLPLHGWTFQRLTGRWWQIRSTCSRRTERWVLSYVLGTLLSPGSGFEQLGLSSHWTVTSVPYFHAMGSAAQQSVLLAYIDTRCSKGVRVVHSAGTALRMPGSMHSALPCLIDPDRKPPAFPASSAVLFLCISLASCCLAAQDLKPAYNVLLHSSFCSTTICSPICTTDMYCLHGCPVGPEPCLQHAAAL
jgi:hypothetical protein